MKTADAKIREAIPDNALIAIISTGKEFQAIRADTGEDVTNYIRRWARKAAALNNEGLRAKHTKTGGIQFRRVNASEVERNMCTSGTDKVTHLTNRVANVPTIAPSSINSNSDWVSMSHNDIIEFIRKAMEYKPDDIIISETKWKYLCRSALRGKNILTVGPTGCGKTLAAQSIAKTFPDRQFFYFNLGASQDPRGMLIGNTHYEEGTGTFFSESLFVKAITTSGAIIMLDEVSRAHDDASNILMTVLDENQRYLRIDEKPDTPTVPVAPGVVFIGTANIGTEYTGVRVMDRALLDRFVIVEMEALDLEDELRVLELKFPNVELKTRESVANIAISTRTELRGEDPKISTIVSTRMSVEMCELLFDGFTLAEVAEVCVYPFFSAAGGTDSERTFMRQLVQKYLPSEFDDKDKPWDSKSAEDGSKVPWE